MKQLNARHPAGEVQVRNQTRSHQVDPRNNRKNINQAGFGLGIPGLRPQVVEARYVGPQTETIVKKVMRSEYKSLVIVLLVMLGTFTALFLLALLLGWL